MTIWLLLAFSLGFIASTLIFILLILIVVASDDDEGKRPELRTKQDSANIPTTKEERNLRIYAENLEAYMNGTPQKDYE